MTPISAMLATTGLAIIVSFLTGFHPDYSRTTSFWSGALLGMAVTGFILMVALS